MLGITVLALAIRQPNTARALTTYQVTSCGDTGAAGQLRTLINAAADGDVIEIRQADCPTITLTSYLFPNANLTIRGIGATRPTISGGTSVQVLWVPIGKTIAVQNVTISGGKSSGSGGGIYVRGSLDLEGSVLAGNHALNGGGIYNDGGSVTINNSILGSNVSDLAGGGIYNAGTMTVTNSTLRDNESDLGAGGGVNNPTGATLTIVNSTLTGNYALTTGGSAIANQGTADLSYTTIAGNLASVTDTVSNWGGTLTLRSSILANNVALNCSYGITNGGYNIEDKTTCGWGSASGSMSSTDPHLGPLANYGGPTPLFALLAGSPAINQIPVGTNGCGTTVLYDQRGLLRPNGFRCDIGAFEISTAINLPLVIK